jgi:hypothetical protein
MLFGLPLGVELGDVALGVSWSQVTGRVMDSSDRDNFQRWMPGNGWRIRASRLQGGL